MSQPSQEAAFWKRPGPGEVGRFSRQARERPRLSSRSMQSGDFAPQMDPSSASHAVHSSTAILRNTGVYGGRPGGGATDQDDRVIDMGSGWLQRKKLRRTRRSNASLTQAVGPYSNLGKYNLTIRLALLIIVLFAFLVGPRHRPNPLPEDTVLKPLDPSPAEAFANIMQRHAKVAFAVIESGATEYPAYNALMRATTSYCTELQRMARHDWFSLSFPQLQSPPAAGWRQWAHHLFSPTPRSPETGWRQWARHLHLSTPDPPEANLWQLTVDRRQSDASWRQWETHWRERLARWRGWFAKPRPTYHRYHRYFGPADEHVHLLCGDVSPIMSAFTNDVVKPSHARMASSWGQHAVTGLRSAAGRLAVLYTSKDGVWLIEDGTVAAASSPSKGDVDGHRALNASLAVPVLKELSGWLTLPRHKIYEDAIPKLIALENGLDLVVSMGEKIVNLQWEQVLAMNRRGHPVNEVAPDESTRKQRQKLNSLGDEVRVRLSALKDVQVRFSGLTAEARVVTGSDVDRLKGWMDSLIAGRGWSQLDQHGEQRVLIRYYFSLPPDLPAWLNSLGCNISERLSHFEGGHWEAMAAQTMKDHLAGEREEGWFMFRLKKIGRVILRTDGCHVRTVVYGFFRRIFKSSWIIRGYD